MFNCVCVFGGGSTTRCLHVSMCHGHFKGRRCVVASHLRFEMTSRSISRDEDVLL